MAGILECAFEEMLVLENVWRSHGVYKSVSSVVWHDDILIFPSDG